MAGAASDSLNGDDGGHAVLRSTGRSASSLFAEVVSLRVGEALLFALVPY